MVKIKPTLNSADFDLLDNRFDKKFDEKLKVNFDLFFERLKRWAGETFATKQELKDTEERLSHQIGQFKDDIITDYKRIDENQIALEGRVFDHETRIEKLEKSAPLVI